MPGEDASYIIFIITELPGFHVNEMNESLAHLGESSVYFVMFSHYFLRERMCKNWSHMNISDDYIRKDWKFKWWYEIWELLTCFDRYKI